MRVTLTGWFTAPLADLEAVRRALPEHISLTLAEPGCLSFDVVEDPATPGHFRVTESFEDAAAFHAHGARVKASDWGRVTQKCTRDYEVRGV